MRTCLRSAAYLCRYSGACMPQSRALNFGHARPAVSDAQKSRSEPERLFSCLISLGHAFLHGNGNRNGCHIYGIELRPDPPAGKSDGQSDQPDGQRIALPANYTLIDHHDEDSDKESSLEQVFKILQTHYAKDIEWTRELELVAANDSKYIPGMKAIPDEKGGPASDKEIADIRFRDRRAQGITPDMEEAAKKAMHENLETGNNLIVVKDVPTGAFSAVCDNLYPYGSLLIYNSDEFCFYGKRAEEILALISGGTMTVDPKRIYYGGGKDGFVGWSSGTTSDKDRHVEDSWINGIREFMDIETYSPDEMAKNPGGKKAGLFSYHISRTAFHSAYRLLIPLPHCCHYLVSRFRPM